MEKWVVVVGIWVMCAACAVLFIRGATGASARRMEREERAGGNSSASGDTRAALND